MVAYQKNNAILCVKRSEFCFFPSLFSYDLIHRASSCVAFLVSQAIDVFATFSTSFKNRLLIMKEIKKLWKIRDSAAEAFYPPDKPIIQVLFRKKMNLFFIILPNHFLI